MAGAELLKIKDLLDMGFIHEEEYQRRRAEILGPDALPPAPESNPSSAPTSTPSPYETERALPYTPYAFDSPSYLSNPYEIPALSDPHNIYDIPTSPNPLANSGQHSLARSYGSANARDFNPAPAELFDQRGSLTTSSRMALTQSYGSDSVAAFDPTFEPSFNPNPTSLSQSGRYGLVQSSGGYNPEPYAPLRSSNPILENPLASPLTHSQRTPLNSSAGASDPSAFVPEDAALKDLRRSFGHIGHDLIRASDSETEPLGFGTLAKLSTSATLSKGAEEGEDQGRARYEVHGRNCDGIVVYLIERRGSTQFPIQRDRSLTLPTLQARLGLTGRHYLEDIFTDEIFDDPLAPIPFGQYYIRPFVTALQRNVPIPAIKDSDSNANPTEWLRPSEISESQSENFSECQSFSQWKQDTNLRVPRIPSRIGLTDVYVENQGDPMGDRKVVVVLKNNRDSFSNVMLFRVGEEPKQVLKAFNLTTAELRSSSGSLMGREPLSPGVYFINPKFNEKHLTLTGSRRPVTDSTSTSALVFLCSFFGDYFRDDFYPMGYPKGISTVLTYANLALYENMPLQNYLRPFGFDEHAWKERANPEVLIDYSMRKIEPTISAVEMKEKIRKFKTGEAVKKASSWHKFDLFNRIGYLQRLHNTEGSIFSRFKSNKCLISGLDISPGDLFHSSYSDKALVDLVASCKESGEWDSIWAEEAPPTDGEVGLGTESLTESERSKKKAPKFNLFTREMMEEAQRKKAQFSAGLREAIGQWDPNHYASEFQVPVV